MRKSGIAATLFAGVLGLVFVLGASATKADTKPQYGGTLEVGTVYVTLSALSWDLADWNWKQNHDTGEFYEQLFAADLSKSKRNGGKHPFYADAWLPSDAIRGELGKLGVEGQPAAHRDQAAQGHHVPRKARRDGFARADRG